MRNLPREAVAAVHRGTAQSSDGCRTCHSAGGRAFEMKGNCVKCHPNSGRRAAERTAPRVSFYLHGNMNRRTFLALAPASMASATTLDRGSIVSRHDVRLNALDPDSPLSVATASSPSRWTSRPAIAARRLRKTVPLCTQSQWGWHSSHSRRAERGAVAPRDVRDLRAAGGLRHQQRGPGTAFQLAAREPAPLNLARIGFVLDGRPLEAEDLGEIEQTLKLWDGAIASRFRLRGAPVRVRTECHATRDAIFVSVDSPLASGRLAIAFDFPYGSPEISASDWNSARSTPPRWPPRPPFNEPAAAARCGRVLHAAGLARGRVGEQRGGASRAADGTGPELPLRIQPAAGGDPAPAPSAKHWAAFWSDGAAST